MEELRYIPNIPDTDKKRIVVVGSGFAGLKFVRSMLRKNFQIVLLDKNNFHQFQPLLYQVATAGLEPSAISFPLRKILQNEQHIHFRIADVQAVKSELKEIETDIGTLKYDYLVLAMGASTNFYGQKKIEQTALSMKSAADAILIRNTILENFELALLQDTPEKAAKYLNIVLVGGGPTGVELAGAVAEMKKYIFPKDYPELDMSKMRIVLYQGSGSLLAGMSSKASARATRYLKNLGVEVNLDTRVLDYDGGCLKLSDGTTISSKTVIWAAGVIANQIDGISVSSMNPQQRIMVDRQNRAYGYHDIFAIGDLSLMKTPKYPHGHPQVAQVAIQQAKTLAGNLIRIKRNASLKSKDFEYRDKGSLATIGRNLAVADLPFVKLSGFLAWILWSFVHLFMIVGVKNRILIFMNWSWNYFTYDQSLRLLIRHKPSIINRSGSDPFCEIKLDEINTEVDVESV
ncbi:MAG: NAD(P)/FAD-dependent oxidoreductase [Bacteroidetes bacterium]|nr:MAG: NAD(P)/FAD-dependent oxidoreductase [Bacteroidota bacterium]RLD93146.1 MAG: NAD(P)/FAD-dependent oxidoreductase [Bacteroidota bacterium]